MNTGAISMRYARALIEFAGECQCDDKLYAGMKQLLRSFREVKEFRTALMNPTIRPADKVVLICSSTGLTDLPAMTRFAQLVVKEQREELLPYMAHCYIELYREKKNIFASKLTTAVPLTPAMHDKIKEMLIDQTQTTVELKEEVDPTIEGGFLFQVGSTRLDASVRNQLMRIKKQFIEQNRRIV